MRVAIVGGNLLGCATAHYVRAALDANRADDADAAGPHDDIVIIEQRAVLGGNKFEVRLPPPQADAKEPRTPVPTGTCAEADVCACPNFSALLTSAGVDLRNLPEYETAGPVEDAATTVQSDAKVQEPSDAAGKRKLPCGRIPGIAYFDTRQDSMSAVYTDFQTLRALWASRIACTLLQLVTLMCTAYVLRFLYAIGVRDISHVLILAYRQTSFLAALVVLTLLGFGAIPMSLVLQIHNAILKRVYFFFLMRTSYGEASSMVPMLVGLAQEHMRAVSASEPAASSGISLAHLLARCGLLKYVSQTTGELCAKLHVPEPFSTSFITPHISLPHTTLEFRKPHETNSLAALLTLLSTVQIPPSLRARATILDAEQTQRLCPAIARKSGARITTKTTVTSVIPRTDSFDAYDIVGKKSNGDEVRLENFDAVILCAALSPTQFSVPKSKTDLRHAFAYIDSKQQSDLTSINGEDSTRYMALVRGQLNAQFFGYSRESAFPDRVIVTNSRRVSEIVRVEPGLYRVTSSDQLTAGSTLQKALFKDVQGIVTWPRGTGMWLRGRIMRRADGDDSPSLILEKRLINAVCLDRIANHPEIDCISARNAASLLRNGTLEWK